MAFWKKYNLYILTVASIIVLIYVIACWNSISIMQCALGLYIFGITLHEWEESRIPGGFFQLMTKKFGISSPTEDSMNAAHGVVVIAIVFFAYVPFFLPDVTWLAMVPAMLGIFEAIIHVVGIKIHNLKKPYTPGMLTAVFVLLPISIWILVIGSASVGWLWLASVAYYICTFAMMESFTMNAFGVNPRKALAAMKERNKPAQDNVDEL